MTLATFPLAVILKGIDQLSGPLGKAETRLHRFGKKARETGRKLTVGLTLPTVLLGAGILRTAVRFEAAMIGVRIQTGASAKELEKFEAQALQLGRKTIFSATEAANAQEILAKAGLDNADVLTATPQVLAFAAAANLELADATGIAVKVMKGQELAAEDLTRITDTLITTQKSALVAVGELAEGFGSGGSIARQFGIEMGETAAAIAELSQRGSEGSEAGTAIRTAIARLAKPPTEARKAFERLNLTVDDFFDKEGNLRGIASAVDTLSEAGKNLDKREFGAALVDIFGLKAGPAILKLFGEAKDGQRVTDKIRETVAAQKVLGVTAADAAARMEASAGSIKKFEAAVEALSISIGKSGLLQWFTKATDKVTTWVTELGEAEPGLLRLGTVATIAAATLGPLLIGLGLIAHSLISMRTAVLLVAPVLKTFVVWIASTAVPTLYGLAAAFFATPVGWVVAGLASIAAGAYVVWQQWDQIKAGAIAAGNAIRSGIGSALDWLSKMASKAVDAMPDWLVSAFSAVGSAGNAAFQFLGSGISDKPSSTVLASREFGGPRGQPIGAYSDRLEAERRNAAGSSAGAESRVRIDFANVAKGTRITLDESEVPVDLALGVSLATG